MRSVFMLRVIFNMPPSQVFSLREQGEKVQHFMLPLIFLTPCVEFRLDLVPVVQAARLDVLNPGAKGSHRVFVGQDFLSFVNDPIGFVRHRRLSHFFFLLPLIQAFSLGSAPSSLAT